jgi:AraC family cel operon transcriptional repressor
MQKLVFDVNGSCTFAVWQYRNTRVGDAHTHDFHELFWVEDGEGMHTINDQCRSMTPGYLILVQDRDYHTFSVPRQGQSVQFINFAFPVQLWKHIRTNHFSHETAFFDLKDFRLREYMLPLSTVIKLKTLYSYLATGHHDALTAETFLLSVLTLLKNHSRHAKKRELTPPWLTRTVKQIAIYPNFTGGTQAMARIAGCSPEHLARSTKKFLTTTPREIVNEARLCHAATMLASTNYSIINIALECGCANLGYFYKIFTARFQMTPSEYRELHNTTLRTVP